MSSLRLLLLSDKTIACPCVVPWVQFLASHKSRFYQVKWGNQYLRLRAEGSGVQDQLGLHEIVSENKPKPPSKSKLYYQYTDMLTLACL